MANVNEQIVQRIDATLPNIPQDDEAHNVLTYIRSQLQPERLAERDAQEDSGVFDTSHLRDVANRRLRPFEAQEASA